MRAKALGAGVTTTADVRKHDVAIEQIADPLTSSNRAMMSLSHVTWLPKVRR
jgi:hypothetical protein